MGNWKLREKRKAGHSVLLPKIKEVTPNRIAKVFRDPGWRYDKEINHCKIRYGKAEFEPI